MWTRALALALAMGGAAGATEAPLSAIGWLSDSVAPAASGHLPGRVSVAPLEKAPGAIGLVPARAAGWPDDVWAGSEAETLAMRLADLPAAMPRPLADILAVLVTIRAEADDPAHVFFLARVDALLALGRLDAAERLLAASGLDGPQAFRRRFDIALLTGGENDECRRFRRHPDVAATYPARIFCLARSGDWQAAALTLETANALGVLDSGETALLGRFLDDGEGALLPPPARPRTVTPLTFRLYEAIGEPLSTRRLPLAFAHADLRPSNGWKARLTAAERLYRAGAIATADLTALYLERAPAASGGVWDRVAAVQTWQRAKGEARAAARAEAAEVLGAAGLGRLVDGAAAAPRAAPIAGDARPDGELAALIASGRRGEAALIALGRAADAWDGDADDLSRALAALVAAGLDPATTERWVARR